MEVDLDAEIGVEVATKKDVMAAIAAANPYERKIRPANGGLVAGDGTCKFRVYDVPDGMIFRLGKFIVWGDAHNPSSGGVYTNAAAWAGLFHGQPGAGNLAEFWPYPEASTFQTLPFTREYGDLPAPEWRSPDNVYFSAVGFPVGENITVLLFGKLISVKKPPR